MRMTQYLKIKINSLRRNLKSSSKDLSKFIRSKLQTNFRRDWFPIYLMDGSIYSDKDYNLITKAPEILIMRAVNWESESILAIKLDTPKLTSLMYLKTSG
jgi:hypothetical protein